MYNSTRNVEVDAVCNFCSKVIPGDDVLKKATTQVNNQVTYIDCGNKKVCPTCVGEFLQYQRILERERRLLSVYIQTCKLYNYSWENKFQDINVSQYLHMYLQLEQFKTDSTYKLLSRPISYEFMQVKEYSGDYSKDANDISGVSFPQNISIPSLKPCVITCPSEGMGLIKLPREKDFILLEKSNFNASSVLEFSLNEMKVISSGKQSPRAGAAGGFMYPGAKSSNLSKKTENERILSIRKNSVAMSLSYKGDDGKVKSFNSVYRDLFMRRLTSKQKYKEAMRSIGYQRILISEMISRLRTFVLLHHLNIVPIQSTIFSFLCYKEDRIKMEKEFIKVGNSHLDAKLLAWACSTGEMRNHQAVHAHFDGNKSHPIESYTLFGRLSLNLRNMTIRVLNDLEEGYLILPLEGITLKLKCGYDIMHCCLTHTLHLADNIRNTCNWSKVHGP